MDDRGVALAVPKIPSTRGPLSLPTLHYTAEGKLGYHPPNARNARSLAVRMVDGGITPRRGEKVGRSTADR
jgi:hypothetical protein